MTNHFNSDLIEIAHVADTLDLEALRSRFSRHFVVLKLRDFIHIDLPRGHVLIFDYGVIILWGVSENKKSTVMAEVTRAAKTSKDLHWEQYKFEVKADAAFHVSNDQLLLADSKTHTIVALSHAFAQSCKLETFEAIAQKIIDDNRYLTQELIEKGKISLNRVGLAKLRGKLFQAKSDIMSRFSLLDVPEYFWENPLTQALYKSLSSYLELQQRTELLNLKLQTIHELFDMLATEENHKHSSFLEWIIIILIAVEIVLFFVH